MTAEKEPLSPKEAAAVLGCKAKHVYALIRDGDLDAIDVGRGERPRWSIDSEAVEAFKEKRRGGRRH